MSVYAVTALHAGSKQTSSFQTVKAVFGDAETAQAWMDAAQKSPMLAKCSNWAIHPCELNPELPASKPDVSVCGAEVQA